MAESSEWSYDGLNGKLVARTWHGPGRPTHLVIISHGYGEHIGRYEWVAGALVDNGATVYAVDHIGHGKSDGERVLVEDFEDIVADLHTLDRTAREENPEIPTVLLGHSMGGLIASRYAQRYGSTLAALVLSSPVAGVWQAVTDMLAMERIPDVPLDVTTLSRDAAVGRMYSVDPLIWHGPFKRPTLEAIRRTLDVIAKGPSVGALPLMWIHGDDDQLVPLEGSRVGVERLRGEQYIERIYPLGRHELFNELNADEVIADVIRFINSALVRR